MVDQEIWFDFHLKTEKYKSEREIEDGDEGEEIEYASDWEARTVWDNYHACTLSSTQWHEGGFKVCAKDLYSPEFLDGFEAEIDPYPEQVLDGDDLVFHIYLLGHDSVVKHHIKFERVVQSNLFNIIWRGGIALSYVGYYDFAHEFLLMVNDAVFPVLKGDS